MGRYPCDNDLKKGPWTSEEDEKLVEYIQENGHGNWQLVSKRAGLNRCGKSCRLRWTNYLRPDIKRGGFSEEEEEMIINLHSVLGNKWSRIAGHLPGRTDNEIKNLWNTHLKKKLLKSGIDPVTHKPINLLLISLSNPFESALMLQAEMAKIHIMQNIIQILNTPPPPPPPSQENIIPYLTNINEPSPIILNQNNGFVDSLVHENSPFVQTYALKDFDAWETTLDDEENNSFWQQYIT